MALIIGRYRSSPPAVTEGQLVEILVDSGGRLFVTGSSGFPAFVVTNLQPGADTVNNDQHVAITRRGSTSTAVFTSELLDGAETQRVRVDTNDVDFGHLFYYFTSAAGAPSVTMRLYFGGLSTLSVSPSLDAEWVEHLFPDYVSDDPTYFVGAVSDATDPSAVFSGAGAVSGTQYRLYGYDLVVGGTAVNAGLEDTAGTDLTALYPFAANGGIGKTLGPQGYIQPSVDLGVRIDKSAAQTVAGTIHARRHPLIVTAATEGIIFIPRVEVLAVELIGTGTAGVDQITTTMRYVGYS